MGNIFGSKPKQDKGLIAAQKRQLNDASRERLQLENEKAQLAGVPGRQRQGRGLLAYAARGSRSSTGS